MLILLPNGADQSCSASPWHQRVHPDVTEYQKLAWQLQLCLSPGDDSLHGGQQSVLEKAVQRLSLRSKGTKTGGRHAEGA